MELQRIEIPMADGVIPAVELSPASPRGGALLLHGYGGCKEELLGLVWRVAERGFAACAIDLRGHGEHLLPMRDSDAITGDIEAALHYCRRFGRLTAIGHSLGGRLALTGTADFAVGISPSLDRTYGEQTQGLLRQMRSYRVNAPSFETLLELQASLPCWQPKVGQPSLVLYGERDAAEISRACKALAAQTSVKEIPLALHGDIFLLEPTFQAIIAQLEAWYG